MLRLIAFFSATLLLLVLHTTTLAADADKGMGVYMNFCSSCHAGGIAGAPKVGDKDAWKPRIAAGMETLTERAINGYQGESGFMPAKGGNSALSDEEVANAVQYMVDQSR